ncbi:MAG: hypothetical protein Q9O24_06475 [Gammaproteobacteria bacterium]|nr:hypothetical protein [Gammaproteobacteria bacterium]
MSQEKYHEKLQNRSSSRNIGTRFRLCNSRYGSHDCRCNIINTHVSHDHHSSLYAKSHRTCYWLFICHPACRWQHHLHILAAVSAGFNNTSGTIGVVAVTGESSHVFDISATATPPAGSGLILDTFTFYDGTSTASSFSLSGGSATIKVGATLTASSSATTAAIPVDVTVVYAP